MELGAYRGRINDLDSHLMVPARRYPEPLGPAGEPLAKRFGPGTPMARFFDPEEGEVEHTPESVWQVKGVRAPGASTVEGRLKTLELMGIDRQLVFPQVLVCMIAWGREGAGALRSYNDFAAGWTRESGGRLRAVGLLDLRDLDGAVCEANRAIDAGARAFLIQDSVPPGGFSPAAPEVDPLWACLAGAETPVLLHIGGQAGFFASSAWGEAELLRGAGMALGEPVNPHLTATVHMSPENYIQTLVLGGVFERHPDLRLGAIELGAGWVGPMAERMEWITAGRIGRRVRETLSLRPTEHLRRNVRVTPYEFEDIGTMLDRYGLDQVYAFSTDFPHPEGGTNPLDRMSQSVDRHGAEMVERLLVTNGEWLLPA